MRTSNTYTSDALCSNKRPVNLNHGLQAACAGYLFENDVLAQGLFEGEIEVFFMGQRRGYGICQCRRVLA